MDIRFEVTVLEDGVEDHPPSDFVWAGDAEPRDWLIIFRGQEPDDAGVRAIVAEVEYQGRTGHESVEACQLSPTGLGLRFARPLQSDWPVEGIEASFAAGCRPSDDFVARLRAIFTGRDASLTVTGNRPTA